MDIGKVTYAGCGIVAATVTRDLRLLDLRSSSPPIAGIPPTVTTRRHRASTQRWSRRFYRQTAIYGMLDGIIFNNRHNGEESVLLYERAAGAIFCPPDAIFPLNDPNIRAEIDAVALAYGIAPGYED